MAVWLRGINRFPSCRAHRAMLCSASSAISPASLPKSGQAFHRRPSAKYFSPSRPIVRRQPASPFPYQRPRPRPHAARSINWNHSRIQRQSFPRISFTAGCAMRMGLIVKLAKSLRRQKKPLRSPRCHFHCQNVGAPAVALHHEAKSLPRHRPPLFSTSKPFRPLFMKAKRFRSPRRTHSETARLETKSSRLYHRIKPAPRPHGGHSN